MGCAHLEIFDLKYTISTIVFIKTNNAIAPAPTEISYSTHVEPDM